MGVLKMKYIHQFLIIMSISFIGELLSLLPLPVPASVYGLLILLTCLFTGVIKLKDVEDVADWLILIMPVLFVPSAVSLMNVGDDSFSALDFKTDASLRKALKDETKESIVLVVAQRISTIMDADQIIVLHEGQVVGKGKHHDLLKTCPIYHEIAASQLSEEELAYE